MPNTSIHSLPYPAPTDPVNVPGDIQALAQAVDTKLIDKAIVNAKGDLIVATADNTVARQGVGANDTVLIADSVQTSGVKWGQVDTSQIADAAVTAGKLAANAAVPAGVINPFAGVNAPSGWLLCDGASVSRSTYSVLFGTFGTTFTSANTTSSSTTVSGLTGMTSAMVGWGIAGTNIPSGATIATFVSATQVTISAAATGTATGTANIAISPYGFTGAGNTTTFLLPDLRQRTPVGFLSSDTDSYTNAGDALSRLGKTGGAKSVILVTSQMPSHTHTQNAHTHTQNSHNHTQNSHDHKMTDRWVLVNAGTAVSVPTRTDTGEAAFTAGTTATNQSTTATNQNATATNQNTGGDGAHNNLQPYLVVNYIIKT